MPARTVCAALLLAALAARAAAQDGATTRPADEGPPPAAVSLSPTGLLDIHARDVDISTVLETLSYQARTGIVSTAKVQGKVSLNLYSVSLTEALDALLIPNGLAYRRSGNVYFVGTRDEIAAQSPSEETRVFRLKFIGSAEAARAVRALLGEAARVSEGGASSEGAAGGAGGEQSSRDVGALDKSGVDYLIVTARNDDLARVRDLLAEIDVQPRQVLIEATVLRATLNETNRLGIDFTALGGVSLREVGSTSNAGADLTTGPLRPQDLDRTTINANTNVASNIDGGFTFGLIKDHVGAFVHALEDVTDVVVVANPKIVALNRQEAEVIVGRRDGYLTTTVTQTAAIQTVEFLETGTQIKFRPLINEDGTVRLSVHPKDSNGGLSAANLPFEETTEAHANILVRDGHTLLIGGLFRERTVGGRAQVPGVGNIPVAGALFQSRTDTTVREEVIILLTVHVLKETEREHDQFLDLLEDVERIRVGSRRGLMGLGRERLSQAFYQEAARLQERGDYDGALLNARMALHNQPAMLSAMKLKEQILQRRPWEADAARMRSFVWRLVDEADAPPYVPPSDRFQRPRGASSDRRDEPPPSKD